LLWSRAGFVLGIGMGVGLLRKDDPAGAFHLASWNWGARAGWPYQVRSLGGMGIGPFAGFDFFHATEPEKNAATPLDRALLSTQMFGGFAALRFAFTSPSPRAGFFQVGRP
jgi:hypothetical protein